MQKYTETLFGSENVFKAALFQRLPKRPLTVLQRLMPRKRA
ncbi:MAG: hypothetical protein ACLR56_13815 [Oscillospiraceae bacterium]